MTARQEKYQDPIKWSSDDNQWFEALALRTIEQTPIHAWGNAIALWRWLPLAWPSTRDRILRRLLEVATKRSDPWPAPLVRRFAEAAIPAFNPAGARGRIHDKEAFEKAARYVAHHPRASERQIANAAQTSRENIRQWRNRPDFAKYVKDEEFLINNTNRALGLSEKYRLDEKAARLDLAAERLRRQRSKLVRAPRSQPGRPLKF